METQLQVLPNNAYADSSSFELAQRMAKSLADSDIVPVTYKGKISNCIIALEMANRMNVSPLMVMQHLFIIQGKPSWSSSFIISGINSSGKFSTPLRFELKGIGETLSCFAYAKDREGNQCKSPTITMAMAREEGWLTKAGSKWKTMPELMIQYRAAAFFGRLYCPEIFMGMQSEFEIMDVVPDKITTEDKEAERLTLMITDATSPDQLEKIMEESNVILTDQQQELFENKMSELKSKGGTR